MSSIYCATSERLIEGIWIGEDTPGKYKYKYIFILN